MVGQRDKDGIALNSAKRDYRHAKFQLVQEHLLSWSPNVHPYDSGTKCLDTPKSPYFTMVDSLCSSTVSSGRDMVLVSKSRIKQTQG